MNPISFHKIIWNLFFIFLFGFIYEIISENIPYFISGNNLKYYLRFILFFLWYISENNLHIKSRNLNKFIFDSPRIGNKLDCRWYWHSVKPIAQ